MPVLPFLHTSNGQIVDDSGTPIRLRGYNIGGWLNLEDYYNGFPGAGYTLQHTMTRILGKERSTAFFEGMLDSFFSEADAAFMASQGANFLRLPFNFRHFEDDERPFEYLEAGFHRLDQAIEWCGKHGLYVLLDMHAVQGWQNPDWHSDNANMWIGLYHNQHFLQRYASLWRVIAARYANNPTVAGYDLMNEPMTVMEYEAYEPSAYDFDGLNTAHRLAAQAIRQVDRRHMLFVEGDQFAVQYGGLDLEFDNNLVVSIHNYIPPTDAPGPYPGLVDGVYWDGARIAQAFENHSGVQRARAMNLPVHVGEFGPQHSLAGRWADDRIRAFADQLAAYEAGGAHWTMWNFKDTGLRRGVVRVAPESEYLRRTATVMAARASIGDWTRDSRQPVGAAQLSLIDKMDDLIGELGITERLDRRRLRQFLRFGYLSHFLQVPFARAFADCSAEQLYAMMGAFHFDRCVIHGSIVSAMQPFIQSPSTIP